jgi:outer membrane biogenesis lipoprotein LolB
MKTTLISIIIFSTLLLTACSDDEGKSKKKLSGDHVWKEQTDTLDKARAVEGILEDAAQEQKKAIEENIQ